MAIASTMPSATLNAWTKLSIFATPWQNAERKGLSRDSLSWHAPMLPSGTHQKPEENGIVGTLSAVKDGPSGHGKKGDAFSVIRRLCAWYAQTVMNRNTAIRDAKPLHIASVKNLPVSADVWCLTVPGVEEFALGNGALSHNSSHAADALRCFAMGYGEAAPALSLPTLPQGPPWARQAFWRGRA